MTNFIYQIKLRATSEFISVILRVLQQLPKHFNRTAISTFVVPLLPVLLVSLGLNFNDSESIMLLFSLSLQYCHRHCHGNIKIFSIIYLDIIYSTYAASK